MKKYTLLEIVQSALTSMGSDQVTDIDDTDESIDVQSIAKDVYFRMMNDMGGKHLTVFAPLTALADATHPNYFQIPDGIEDISMLSYNVKEAAADANLFKEITYIEDPSEFVSFCNTRDSTDTAVDTITDFGGADLLIRNDKVPSYWTTFDDVYIVFDSWLETLDATMPADKTQVIGKKVPTWTASNSFVPDMPGKFFPAYLEEVKSVCYADMKQTSTIHTSKAASSNTILSQNKTRTKNPRGTRQHPHYGRK
jgi:hypothetical protein